jgi:DNA polymerase III subunit gamma/tau
VAQALYRKYRSKSLQEVVGQEHITDTLHRALENGVTSHAYLFTGLRGTGKTSVARILAHNINDLPYTDDSSHLDIIEIDAASNRRIDDVRDLREKVHIAPANAKYKVYIIDEVHMLTGESFNALLKTLEEPPEHVVFILATTEVHKLPATIISRTQRFHFRPVPKGKVVGHLRYIAEQEKIKIDDEALALIAEHGEGSFRDSISLLDQLAAMCSDAISAAFVEKSLGLASSSKIVLIISQLKAGKRNELHTLLQTLEDQGVNAAILSGQLIRALKNEALNDPRFYTLIESLIDIPKSSQPGLKLFVTLLTFIQNPSTSETTPSPAKHMATRAAAPVLHTVKETPKVLKKPAAPKPTDKTSQKTEQTAETPAVTLTKGTALTSDDWPKVLAEIRSSNPPLFSMIKNADPRFSSDGLTLAFSFKLHQIKLDDSRYRTKFNECVSRLGFACPALTVVHDAAATAPVFAITADQGPAENETAVSVLAMMGGGDIVDA